MAPFPLTRHATPTPGELHIWCWPPPGVGAGRARGPGFRGPALGVLAGYLDRPAASLRTVCEARGKPRLAGAPDLNFSLSDSGGAGVLAVSASPVGIDLEALRHRDWDDLAHRLLDPAAWSAFQVLALAARPLAFAHAWTQREAFVKATGLGLGDGWPSMRAAFDGRGPAPGPIARHHPLQGGRWHLRTITLWPGYACTVCTRYPAHTLHIRQACQEAACP